MVGDRRRPKSEYVTPQITRTGLMEEQMTIQNRESRERNRGKSPGRLPIGCRPFFDRRTCGKKRWPTPENGPIYSPKIRINNHFFALTTLGDCSWIITCSFCTRYKVNLLMRSLRSRTEQHLHLPSTLFQFEVRRIGRRQLSAVNVKGLATRGDVERVCQHPARYQLRSVKPFPANHQTTLKFPVVSQLTRI